MTFKEQQRRRELKRERRSLDRAIGALAHQGKGLIGQHLPSTRAKQAKWHHELVDSVHARIEAYRAAVNRMRQIDEALREGLAPRCAECGMDAQDIRIIRTIGLDYGAVGFLRDPEAICCEGVIL